MLGEEKNRGPATDHVKQVRYHTLVDGQFNEGKLFKLKRSWVLRLQLSSELIHKNVRLFCNIPSDVKQKFVRSTFYEYAWTQPADSIPNDEFNRYVEIECYMAGSFRYYFIYADESTGESSYKSLYLNNL